MRARALAVPLAQSARLIPAERIMLYEATGRTRKEINMQRR